MLKIDFKTGLPFATCDQCGRRIEQVSEGVFLYHEKTGDVLFAHHDTRGVRCHDLLEAKSDARSWHNLSNFLERLAENYKERKRRRRRACVSNQEARRQFCGA